MNLELLFQRGKHHKQVGQCKNQFLKGDKKIPPDKGVESSGVREDFSEAVTFEEETE